MHLTNYCYLDIETKKSSEDFPDGWGTPVPNFLNAEEELCTTNILRMEFGVACTFDNREMKFWTEPSELLLYLLDENVDAIVTFNGERFDFPLLLAGIDVPEQKDGVVLFSEGFKDTYSQFIAKSCDMLRDIETQMGHRIQLDQITGAIFGTTKEIEGKAWWQLYNSNDIVKRTTAINYLLGDVIQLNKIYGVASELGQLAYKDTLGHTKKFNLRVKTAEDLKK